MSARESQISSRGFRRFFRRGLRPVPVHRPILLERPAQPAIKGMAQLQLGVRKARRITAHLHFMRDALAVGAGQRPEPHRLSLARRGVADAPDPQPAKSDGRLTTRQGTETHVLADESKWIDRGLQDASPCDGMSGWLEPRNTTWKVENSSCRTRRRLWIPRNPCGWSLVTQPPCLPDGSEE
jgi:hypothetical protein